MTPAVREKSGRKKEEKEPPASFNHCTGLYILLLSFISSERFRSMTIHLFWKIKIHSQLREGFESENLHYKCPSITVVKEA